MTSHRSSYLSCLWLGALLTWFSLPSAWAEWPLGLNGGDDDEVVLTKPSTTGDVFVVGHFSGSLDTGAGRLISNGLQDIFIARVGPTGEVLWAESAGGASLDVVNDIAVDEGDNVYLVGDFFGSPAFGGTTLTAATASGQPVETDGFVAKIDANGSWKWAARIGKEFHDTAQGVATLPGDTAVVPPVPESVVVVGSYQCESRVFGADPSDSIFLFNDHCPEGSDLFVARWSGGGEPLWAVDRGGSATGRESASSIEIDKDGRAWIVGEFADGGTQTLINDTFNDGSLSPWSSTNTRYGTVTRTEGQLSWVDEFCFRFIDICADLTFVGEYGFFNRSWALALRGRSVRIESPVYDTSNSQQVSAELDVFSGFNDEISGQASGSGFSVTINNIDAQGIYSEQPNAGEDLRIQFWGSDNRWHTVRTLPGSGPGGELIELVGADRIVITDPRAFHSGFKLGLRFLGGNGPFTQQIGDTDFSAYNDWWHIDNVLIDRIGPPRGMVVSMSSLRNSTPIIGDLQPLPQGLVIDDVELYEDPAGILADRLLLAGNRSGTVTFSPCAPVGGNGAFIASLSLSTTGDVSCAWVDAISGGTAGGVTADDQGNVYTVGSFDSPLSLFNGATTLQPNNGNSDIYIASLDYNGAPLWATGGSEFNPDTGIPARAGGFGEDRGQAIATDGFSNLYIAGSFTEVAVFGEDASITAISPGTDAFVASLGTNGLFFEEAAWTAGVALVPPPNAKVDDFSFQPDFRVDGQSFDALGEDVFLWAAPIDGADARLIPLQPISNIEVLWRVQGEPPESDQRISSLGGIGWPVDPCADNQVDNCFQVHVVDAPVEANAASGEYRVLNLINPTGGASNATLDSGIFTAPRSGTSILVYINGPELDPLQYPVEVEIVRTMAATSTPLFTDNVPVQIGDKITDPYHNELGKTGFVANELAYYDGVGPDAAYNRAARTGAIIPVNRTTDQRPQDQGRELIVSWYRQKAKGVFWPDKAVRYAPFWPPDPDRIIIASEQGGEVLGQQPLDPQIYESARIYVQNERELPGYNPNDEHALLLPSNSGTPYDAVYALRSDFGARLEGDDAAASDPYVLVKYFDSVVLEWKFRIYEVEATGAGFSGFRFTGTAGTTVAPPYPLSALTSCSETFVEGQAVGEQPPPPFFQDYTAQLWSKSAGSGAVRYFYPAQPGFVVDLDNNDQNDVDPGDCVPWLARLPEAEGGSGTRLEPILVEYDIAWPDESPLLVAGETLLTPKRGLPDIFNQAAVEVVFDEIQSTQEDPLPSDTLAQLIDPLNPRSVVLPAVPGSIATELRTDGTEAILGSADLSVKLPASIRQRLSYDPLNQVLSLTGIFDESGIGDPFLLLNVLSKSDRIVMKTLDGGDGTGASDYPKTCATLGDNCSWDEAVEALFRLSRNPQGIEEVCETSSINEDRVRVCDASRPVNEDDVLVGLQDSNGDFVLEPFQAVGVRPALTAGSAQGSGFLTIALNNDPSLNPLPVSLEILQVGCLVSPPPPATPEIFSSFQGQIQVIEPDNIFDEQLVLRHSGDFGGNPDILDFEWFFHPDTGGGPPLPLPDPETGQLNGWIQFPTGDPQGAVEISIEGANIRTLSDNWYVARYRGLPGCNNENEWSIFAGAPSGTAADPSPQLAEGWVKRVLKRLNPFDARVQDFAQAATNNFASMLVQLGERYEGPIPLTNDPDVINDLGLIEAYTTVMRRALQLSVDGTPPVDYGPANNAILQVASRIVDFYTLLGNEAFADAQDPTIGITTSGGDFSLAPTIFNFQNQMASLLEEELTLLRGRDNSLGGTRGAPVYNRLFWNFTTGDGEVAYAQSYNISDQNVDGVIDEFDARILYPQGHGDAWGHYLTGTDIYYDLLRHPFYSWNPRSESILVAGEPIDVDFLDERQFAETAAAKARTGAEIVDLTYRAEYVADPNGQFQGYEDTDQDRGWGLSEWGARAGMAAYFDWVTVNAILPAEDPDPTKVGIERVERGTVSELDEIIGQYQVIQDQVDEADAGLNPLGLAEGVVVFDMDPVQLDRFNRTNTEQVIDSARSALENAVDVWDFANQLSNQMRRNQNEVEDLQRASRAQETDFANQLIEIFGTPYADDIGPAGTYPAGYNGADLYNYMLIDVPLLAGTAFDFEDGINDLGINRVNRFTGTYTPTPNGINFFDWTPSPEGNIYTGDAGVPCDVDALQSGCALGDLTTEGPDGNNLLEVEYTTIESPDFGFWFTKPEEWTGQRRAPGQLQQILQKMLQGRIELKRSLTAYDRLRQEMEAKIDELEATFATTEENLNLTISQRNQLKSLTTQIGEMNRNALIVRKTAELVGGLLEGSANCIPKNLIAGLAGGGDLASGARCALRIAGLAAKNGLETAGDVLEFQANAKDAAKEDIGQLTGINTAINDAELDLFNLKGELDEMLREEPVLRADIYARSEAIKQHVNDYKATLARGLRTLERLKAFRRNGAAAVQEYRYQDMAFRIFRNDALQKYRAAFDLAARYVYLAAQAYDYDTNLLGSNGQAGQQFLTDIVRQRSLGQILAGEPQPGVPGLAGTLAELSLNFDVLKGQMGFNNPQIETNRFSLREELFRIPPGPEGDEEWRAKLRELRVDNLWNVPDFRRFARPFAPESAGPQPGLVIEFPTTVTFGLNYFGWELGPGDSSYDSSQFATRVRSVGSWFRDYNQLPLADDPRIYMIPAGADVLRAPDPFDFRTREWQIVEQVLPIPFPVDSQDLERFDWFPNGDTLIGSPTDIRRYGRFRAYHLSEPFDPAQVTADSRIIGRSVWNTKWLMIIPGGTLLNDSDSGLDTFIEGQELPGGGGRDGNGVSDIMIFFTTYAYQGI